LRRVGCKFTLKFIIGIAFMKIILVAGCSVCPHGARWELDKPHFMCSKAMKINVDGPKPPQWCPLQDAIQFVKEIVNQQPTPATRNEYTARC